MVDKNRTERDRDGNVGDRVQEPFRAKAYDLALQPGIDYDKLNQLLDELEVEEFLAREREQSA